MSYNGIAVKVGTINPSLVEPVSCLVFLSFTDLSDTGADAATRWACEHLHLYFYGKLVTIYTDHKACPQFLLMSEVLVTANGRIHNWRNRTAS